MSTFLEPALAYASRGERVLPIWPTDEQGVCGCPAGQGCRSTPGKHPIGKLVPNGVHDASDDPEVIKSWASWCSKANIARGTDKRPTIDIDLPEVAEPLAQDVALAQETELIRTPGRNGLHIVLATDAPAKGRTLYLADGRTLGELKGAGGYALVPPSRIAGRPYERLSPVEVLPLQVDDPVAWLRKLLPALGFELAKERPSGQRDYEALGGTIYEGDGRHDALKSYAGRVWIEGISSEGFVGALQAINRAQCRPPLPDDELQSIAQWFIDGREQGRLPHTDEEAWADLAAAADPSTNGAPPEPAPPWQPVPLPDTHYVRRYTRYAQSRTDAPPQYHETLAVIQLSAVVGRGVRIPLAAKPDGMRCNVLLLLLGDSTLFRKSTCQDLAIDLLRVIDDGMFLANDQSPQGFVQEMAMHDGGTSLWHRDEFRSFVAQLKNAGWMAGGKELLMKLFDGSPYHRRLRTKTVKGQSIADEEYVRQPYLVAIAAGVTSRIIDVLTVDDVVDGFIPRFLVVAPKMLSARRPASTITGEMEAKRSALIHTLRSIYTGFQERGECSVQFDPGVLDRWNAYAARIEAEASASPTPDIFGPIAGRIADYALKLASLLQAAEGAPPKDDNLHLSMPMLEAAIELCERLRNDAEELAMEIGSSISERRLTRFVQMVKHHPGIARREAARSLKMDKRRMDDLQATALDRELITCATRNTGGRKALCYYPQQ